MNHVQFFAFNFNSRPLHDGATPFYEQEYVEFVCRAFQNGDLDDLKEAGLHPSPLFLSHTSPLTGPKTMLDRVTTKRSSVAGKCW